MDRGITYQKLEDKKERFEIEGEESQLHELYPGRFMPRTDGYDRYLIPHKNPKEAKEEFQNRRIEIQNAAKETETAPFQIEELKENGNDFNKIEEYKDMKEIKDRKEDKEVDYFYYISIGVALIAISLISYKFISSRNINGALAKPSK